MAKQGSMPFPRSEDDRACPNPRCRGGAYKDCDPEWFCLGWNNTTGQELGTANVVQYEWCHKRAGWGTDHVRFGHCKFHGGNTAMARHGAEMETARREMARLADPVVIEQGQALLRALWAAYGELTYLEGRLGELAEKDIDVYAETFHVSGKPTGEAKRHILVQMYEDAIERVAAIAGKALSAGVEERRVRLVETDARRLFGAVTAAAAKSDMPPEIADRFRRALAEEVQRLDE